MHSQMVTLLPLSCADRNRGWQFSPRNSISACRPQYVKSLFISNIFV